MITRRPKKRKLLISDQEKQRRSEQRLEAAEYIYITPKGLHFSMNEVQNAHIGLNRKSLHRLFNSYDWNWKKIRIIDASDTARQQI
jgi:hypothetical protein